MSKTNLRTKPREEFENESDAKHFLRKLSLVKRSRFLRCFATVILTLITAFAELPFMSAILLANTKVSMTVLTALFAVIMLINLDMFGSIPRAFSPFLNAGYFCGHLLPFGAYLLGYRYSEKRDYA